MSDFSDWLIPDCKTLRMGGLTFDERTQIFGSRRSSMGVRLTKGRRIEKLFADTLRSLSKVDIVAKLPDISVTAVERTLKELLDAGKIVKLGKGGAVRYIGNKQCGNRQ